MKLYIYINVLITALVTQCLGAEIVSNKIEIDLVKAIKDENIWKSVKPEVISLMAQPMIAPRPKTTETSKINVQSLHNNKHIAFRLEWDDQDFSEAGKLGEYSDGVALQFPVKDGTPPIVFMGSKDNPVHLYHWRAMYQHDRDTGRIKDIKGVYPNLNPDIYYMDYKDEGNLKGHFSEEDKKIYNPGRAAGNPQSFPKVNGVDEIFAEGYGSSAVQDIAEAEANGVWKNKKWTIVIVRPMKSSVGSELAVGKDSNIAFAVWQGGKGEAGSRKSVTMMWTPLKIK